MYGNTNWKDHVTEFPNRRKLTDNGDGTVNLTKDQGRIIQRGTPQSATNFNHMELGITDASVAAAIFSFYELQSQRLEERNPDLYDALIASRIQITGSLQQRRLNDAEISEIRAGLESRVTDQTTALEILTAGNLQQQRINDERFNLIASETLGESHTVTLTNTQKFPFNSTADNPVTVALNTRRKNLFYSVEAEITAHTGPTGDIAISGKQLNGFKISFDGSGSSVTVLLRIKGGMMRDG